MPTHHASSPEIDVIVIGGGPAASASARLLAAWGHRVTVLAKGGDRGRGQAESLPPSTAKLLSAIGVRQTVEGAGFYRSTGNTVWWGSGERRLEAFESAREQPGLQVFRPDFDRLLLQSAREAGADVLEGATVRDVVFERDVAALDYEREDGSFRRTARVVLDASGRAGVIARRGFRRHERPLRMQALMGVWHRETGWELPDDTHTIVETFEDGWAWSVPVSPVTRHMGVMVDGGTSHLPRASVIREVYRGLLEKTRSLRTLAAQATLLHSWACDASIYRAEIYASPQFLLVGDAASAIDPLSSFGVKKALASGWMAAVAVHTFLSDSTRRALALDYFAAWERQVFASHMRHTRDFALQAHAQHPHEFWARRAELTVDAVSESSEDSVIADPAVHAALDVLRSRPTLDLVRANDVPLEKRPVIRDREIVLADAVPLRGRRSVLRFVRGVDLVRLCELACQHRHVAELYDAYCRHLPPASLPDVLGGLSVLVAHGVLQPRPVEG